MDEPRLLGAGRDADVFALTDGRVLRRYRDGSDATAEAELMAFVAAHGFPVPALHSAAGPELVMEFLDGVTMGAAVESGALDARAAGRMLAQLHNRLHAVPPRPIAAPGDRVIHLDLHPDNVVITPRGPVVIDWRNATDGAPELDVALAALLLAQVAVADDVRAAMVHPLLAEFLAGVDHDPLPRLDEAVARRAADVNVTPAERDRLPAATSLVRGSVP